MESGYEECHVTQYTEWFPADVKPVREGIYETKSPVMNDDPGRYSYWNGGSWGGAYMDNRTAFAGRHKESMFQNRPWRGLTSEKPE